MRKTDNEIELLFCDGFVSKIKNTYNLIGFNESMIRSKSTLYHIAFELSKKLNKKAMDNFEISAFILHRIATKHPFIDGNKRTAFLSAISFLGWSFGIEKEVIANFYNKIYSKEKSELVEEIKSFMLELADKKRGKSLKECIEFLKGIFPKIKK